MFLILFLFSSIQFLINTPFLDTDTKIPINCSPYPPTSIVTPHKTSALHPAQLDSQRSTYGIYISVYIHTLPAFRTLNKPKDLP